MAAPAAVMFAATSGISTAVLMPLVAANMTAAGAAIPLGYLATVPIGLVLALALAGFAHVILGDLEE